MYIVIIENENLAQCSCGETTSEKETIKKFDDLQEAYIEFMTSNSTGIYKEIMPSVTIEDDFKDKK